MSQSVFWFFQKSHSYLSGGKQNGDVCFYWFSDPASAPKEIRKKHLDMNINDIYNNELIIETHSGLSLDQCMSCVCVCILSSYLPWNPGNALNPLYCTSRCFMTPSIISETHTHTCPCCERVGCSPVVGLQPNATPSCLLCFLSSAAQYGSSVSDVPSQILPWWRSDCSSQYTTHTHASAALTEPQSLTTGLWFMLRCDDTHQLMHDHTKGNVFTNARNVSFILHHIVSNNIN